MLGEEIKPGTLGEGIHLSFMYAVFLSLLTINLERCLKEMFESEVFYLGDRERAVQFLYVNAK